MAAPIFWLPWKWPYLTLAALPLLPLSWALTWRRRGRLSAASGLEAPLVYVLLATCVATIPVSDWELALPKLLGMALGAATLVSITHAVTSRHSLRTAMVLFALLTFGLSALAVTGVGWNGGKTPALAALYTHLPSLLRGNVPGTPQGSIHPNELAGVLVLVVAPLFSRGIGLTQLWLRERSRSLLLQLVLALGVGVVALGGILLTQARSGVAGAAASLAIVAGVLVWRVVRSPEIRTSLRVGVGVVYLGCVVAGATLIVLGITRWLASGTTSDNLDTFASRLELWDRSLAMLQDFAFTGIGLGQFDRVLHALYVPLLNGPLEVVPHAHNLLLEYALELGIPGAVAMLFVVIAFFRQCFRAMAARDADLRWAGTGLGAGMIGYVVYGSVDAIAPGARAGIILWIVLGLGAAAGTIARPAAVTAARRATQ